MLEFDYSGRAFILISNEYLLFDGNKLFYYEKEFNKGIWLWKSKRKMTCDYIGFFRFI